MFRTPLFILDATRARRALPLSSASALTLVAALALPAWADPPPPPEQDWVRTETRDDCADADPLRQPYFGDLHVHTKYSADSVLVRVRSDPRDAYDFAKGATLGLPPYDAFDVPARTATIDRALDFTAVTDHAEGFGEARICLNAGYDGYDDPICAALRATFDNEFVPQPTPPDAFLNFFLPLNVPAPTRFSLCGPGNADCLGEAALVWQDTLDAAEEHYDRTSACGFTTFNAYEWTSSTGGDNLHRNVIFRNDDVPAMPISYYEEWTVEGLWAQLRSQCLEEAGECDVIAIPHNSNQARDAMFPRRMNNGELLSAEYATERAEMEPLVEIFNDKGDSECRDRTGGTADELCNFEKLSRQTLSGTSNWNAPFSPRAYARFALRDGLSQEKRIGVNPFRFGIVGGTDTHNATPGLVSEIDYPAAGHLGISESAPQFILHPTPPGRVEGSGGGLTVLWAEENSRDALFSAMRRREAYATSGTRPVVRMFAGRLAEDLCDDPDFVAHGYDKGVPMGGEIGPELGKFSPRIAVLAHKDPGTMDRPGTPLQRIQIVKGWIDAKGATHETVYDIAGSADNGAGVNLDTCEETGTGAETLCAVWTDRKFKATEKAFYYARVVENPVCRWSKRLCNDLSVDCSDPESVPAEYATCCDPFIPWTIQERAVTSPIWYHPERVGVAKGQVTFGSGAFEDRLLLRLLLPSAPAQLDPAAEELTVRVREAGTLLEATFPAGTMDVKKPGATYLYKDKTGAIGGVTLLKLKISSKGVAQVSLKAAGLDLSTISGSDRTLTVDLVSGDYESTTTREWSYAAPKLKVVF